MATYEFVSITCITPSTGVSGFATSLIEAIGSAAGGAVAGALTSMTGPGALAMGAVGSIAGGILGHGAGSFLEYIGSLVPDELYIEVDRQRVWPDGGGMLIGVGEKQTPSIRGEFNHPINITLKEWDEMSGDDNLGEFLISPGMTGNGFAYLVANPEEGDVYEVVLNIS